jgi:pSer/pThr/pTyr-binding forkhead associated (FHA) protein
MPAWLVALTEEAREALQGDQRILERFPFKVGRETRAVLGRPPISERRLGQAPPLNDIYLVDLRPELEVSREHFLIDVQGDQYFIEDRGSACGTLVEGQKLGGEREGGRAELHDNDVIIVGTSGSPFVFKFRCR